MLHTGAKAKLTKLNVNTDEKYVRVRQSFGRIGSLRVGVVLLYPRSRFLGELETGSSCGSWIGRFGGLGISMGMNLIRDKGRRNS